MQACDAMHDAWDKTVGDTKAEYAACKGKEGVQNENPFLQKQSYGRYLRYDLNYAKSMPTWRFQGHFGSRNTDTRDPSERKWRIYIRHQKPAKVHKR